MPNWCSTCFRFHGNREEIKKLHNCITKWTSKGFAKSDFGSCWLGNILYGAGLGDRIDNPNHRLSCRGAIADIGEIEESLNDYCFSIFTETAWTPMVQMWAAVIEELKLTIVGFCFVAEEPGCGIWWIYDPNGYGDFDNEQVYLDVYTDGGYPELVNAGGYYTKEQAVEVLNKCFHTKYTTLKDFDKLVSKINNDDTDTYVYINLFKYIDEIYE